MTLPSFLIVGAIKAGTTSLYHYLIQHPNVFLSPDVKESRFLAGLSLESNPEIAQYVPAITVFDEYERLFSKATEHQVVGEVDPWYLYLYDQTIPRIKTFLGDFVRIIICLRNPVGRSYSHYYHVVKQGWETRSFEATFECVVAGNKCHWYERSFFEASLYYESVKAYIEAFGSDQVLIFLFDEFCSNPISVFQQICRFIGVDDHFIPNVSERANVGGLPRSKMLHYLLTRKSAALSVIKPLLPLDFRRNIRYKLINQNLRRYPPMSDVTRRRLIDFYREDVLKLQSLIERDLSAWLT